MKRAQEILFKPRRELERLQDRTLHHFITKYLYPSSPYYRRLFDQHKIDPARIRTRDGLRAVPFSSKETFIEALKKDPENALFDFCLRPGGSTVLQGEYKPIFLTATAGTTHHPIPFLYTRYDIQNLYTSGRRLLDIGGINKDKNGVSVLPYAPHLAFWQAVFSGLAAEVFILSTGGGKTVGTEGNLRTILKIKPEFLIGVSSYVYHILKTAAAQRPDMRFLKQVVLGAGRVPVELKAKIRDLLGSMGATDTRVLGTYGFTEARSAWAECPTPSGASSGYHTYPDKEIFEVIDPKTGEVRGEGEDGELVYTSIDGRGTCVLRYRTGDLVKGGILYEPCPHCGRTVPRISGDISRLSDIRNFRLSKLKGALVNLNDLEEILDDQKEIREWQVEIRKKDDDPFEVDELTLYAAVPEETRREEFSRRLNEEVLTECDVSFNRIIFVPVEEIHRRIEIETAVKAKKIIDKRPAG